MKYWQGMTRYDKRIIERLIKKGAITREEYEEYLKNLPDLSDKTEELTIQLETGDENVREK